MSGKSLSTKQQNGKTAVYKHLFTDPCQAYCILIFTVKVICLHYFTFSQFLLYPSYFKLQTTWTAHVDRQQNQVGGYASILFMGHYVQLCVHIVWGYHQVPLHLQRDRNKRGMDQSDKKSYFKGSYWIKRRASSFSNSPLMNSPSATRSRENKINSKT